MSSDETLFKFTSRTISNPDCLFRRTDDGWEATLATDHSTTKISMSLCLDNGGDLTYALDVNNTVDLSESIWLDNSQKNYLDKLVSVALDERKANTLALKIKEIEENL